VEEGSPLKASEQNSSSPKKILATSTHTKAALADVVFVRKQNAKTVKTAMEKLNFLDKRYRMTPVSDESVEDGKEIAVPITEDFLHLLSNETALKEEFDSWISLLEGSGRQEMPFSTSQFANAKKKANS
jgi:hypothetical protein